MMDRRQEASVVQKNVELLAQQPWLDEVAKPLSEAVRALFSNAGPAGQTLKNALHGVWLGHPLHPVLTDVPIGAWTAAVALDATEAATGDRGYGRAADVAFAVGLVGAVGAAVTGLNDWSETEGRSRRLGLLHGMMNIGATALVVTGMVLRRNHSRRDGAACTAAGFGVSLAAAYLGGDLVYHERIGVTHAVVHEPETFTPVLASSELPDNGMRKATIEDASFLLVRQDGRVCALAHSCAHLGGPLSEGTLKDGSVVCPWHDSEFDLHDGHVINGPATQPQPCFVVRERDGQIEVSATGPRP
jgi:nitrite reductase/ring-hydroxylating ferredoxin subunit/uncharacterized membrane protein